MEIIITIPITEPVFLTYLTMTLLDMTLLNYELLGHDLLDYLFFKEYIALT